MYAIQRNNQMHTLQIELIHILSLLECILPMPIRCCKICQNDTLLQTAINKHYGIKKNGSTTFISYMWKYCDYFTFQGGLFQTGASIYVHTQKPEKDFQTEYMTAYFLLPFHQILMSALLFCINVPLQCGQLHYLCLFVFCFVVWLLVLSIFYVCLCVCLFVKCFLAGWISYGKFVGCGQLHWFFLYLFVGLFLFSFIVFYLWF